MAKSNKRLFFKFLSFIIAIFLWFLAMGDINPNRTKEFVNIPVKYSGLQKGLVITKEGRKNIDIKISGRRNEISEVHRGDFDIEVDLRKLGPGEHRVKLYDKDEFRFNNYQTIYEPEYIDLKIEKIIDKKFDIRVEINGELKEGFDTEKMSISSKSCVLKGPESIVNSVSKVVAVLEAKSISSNKPIKKELIAVDKNGKLVKGLGMSVESVSIDIPFGDSNTVKVEPNIVGNLEEGYQIESVEINPQSITLIKQSSDIGDINKISTENIDITGANESFEKRIGLLIPEGFKYNRENTANIKINIKKVKEEDDEEKDRNLSEKEINLSIGPDNIINKSEDLKIINLESINANISISVEGEKDNLTTLDASALKLNLDLSNIKESGDYNIPINAILENDSIKIKSIRPETIQIKLKKEETEEMTN